ncbi:hypothetical protein DPMN_174637 [Dreissena polymorpha]|uniref:Uncharacterized protein n=1 Tax=Dreissena polymorpha TaxID=45954 RepID=A0A9D4E5Q8_DREPO|nr:hypothetical protein DPMN_174637 [Dreissena polymorpha]
MTPFANVAESVEHCLPHCENYTRERETVFSYLYTCTGIRPTEVTETVLLTTNPNDDDDPWTQNCKQIVEELSRFVQATKRFSKPILHSNFPLHAWRTLY